MKISHIARKGIRFEFSKLRSRQIICFEIACVFRSIWPPGFSSIPTSWGTGSLSHYLDTGFYIYIPWLGRRFLNHQLRSIVSFLEGLIQSSNVTTLHKQCSDLRIIWLQRLWKVTRIDLESETSKASTEMCLDLNPQSPRSNKKLRHWAITMVTPHLDCHRASSLGGRYLESAFHLAKPDNSYKFQVFHRANMCKYVQITQAGNFCLDSITMMLVTPKISSILGAIHLIVAKKTKKIGNCHQVTNSFQGPDIHCNSISMLHVIQVLPFIPWRFLLGKLCSCHTKWPNCIKRPVSSSMEKFAHTLCFVLQNRPNRWRWCVRLHPISCCKPQHVQILDLLKWTSFW